MRHFLSVGLALAALTYAAQAQAEMTSRDLLKMYDSGKSELREQLEAVIDGNSNGISWMNSYLDEYRGTSRQVYCPPDEFTVDGPGMIAMMRTAIASDPRYADLPYGAAVMFAYIHRFPCP